MQQLKINLDPEFEIPNATSVGAVIGLSTMFCLKEKSKCIKRKNSSLSSRIFLAKTKKEKKNPKDECITKNLNTPLLT